MKDQDFHEIAEPDHWSQQPLRRAVGRFVESQRCGCKRERAASGCGSVLSFGEAMSLKGKALVIAVVLVVFAGFGAWVIYEMFIEGTTGGPDFVRAIQSGRVTPDMISSIEVVAPEVGYTASSAKELASLVRRADIHSATTISHLLGLLRSAQAGWAPRAMNHPVISHRTFLKVNVKDGFFWLYCEELEDANGAFLSIKANTQNATNPNGASSYNLGTFTEILNILEHGQNTEPPLSPDL